MILVDANLLIYAVNVDTHNHVPARAWLEETLSGTTEVGMPWIVLVAFLRITTRSTIFPNPLSPETALEYVDEWLTQPFVRAIGPGINHWSVFYRLVRDVGTAGNLTSDAHLAALAIENDATLYSTDNDFKRFSNVRHVNPLV